MTTQTNQDGRLRGAAATINTAAIGLRDGNITFEQFQQNTDFVLSALVGHSCDDTDCPCHQAASGGYDWDNLRTAYNGKPIRSAGIPADPETTRWILPVPVSADPIMARLQRGSLLLFQMTTPTGAAYIARRMAKDCQRLVETCEAVIAGEGAAQAAASEAC